MKIPKSCLKCPVLILGLVIQNDIINYQTDMKKGYSLIYHNNNFILCLYTLEIKGDLSTQIANHIPTSLLYASMV